MLNRGSLCRWKNTVAPLYRLPTLPGALLWVNYMLVCRLSLSLSLSPAPSLSTVSSYVSVCIFVPAFILSNIYGRPCSPRGCWPAGYLSGPVRDTLFPVQRSGRPGWWRHKSPTTLFRGAREYRTRWHGHVENTPVFFLSLFCGIRHSQLTLFSSLYY